MLISSLINNDLNIKLTEYCYSFTLDNPSRIMMLYISSNKKNYVLPIKSKIKKNIEKHLYSDNDMDLFKYKYFLNTKYGIIFINSTIIPEFEIAQKRGNESVLLIK